VVLRIEDRNMLTKNMGEVYHLCCEAGHRQQLMLWRKSNVGGRPPAPMPPLHLNYLADRLDIDDPLRGYVVRHRAGGWLQGFLCLTTFTHWQLWFQWNSLAPEAGLELGLNPDGSLAGIVEGGGGGGGGWSGFGKRQRKLDLGLLPEHEEVNDYVNPNARPVSRNSKAGRRLAREKRGGGKKKRKHKKGGGRKDAGASSSSSSSSGAAAATAASSSGSGSGAASEAATGAGGAGAAGASSGGGSAASKKGKGKRKGAAAAAAAAATTATATTTTDDEDDSDDDDSGADAGENVDDDEEYVMEGDDSDSGSGSEQEAARSGSRRSSRFAEDSSSSSSSSSSSNSSGSKKGKQAKKKRSSSRAASAAAAAASMANGGLNGATGGGSDYDDEEEDEVGYSMDGHDPRGAGFGVGSRRKGAAEYLMETQQVKGLDTTMSQEFWAVPEPPEGRGRAKRTAAVAAEKAITMLEHSNPLRRAPGAAAAADDDDDNNGIVGGSANGGDAFGSNSSQGAGNGNGEAQSSKYVPGEGNIKDRDGSLAEELEACERSGDPVGEGVIWPR
jgi:hypothetical protein